MKWHKNAQVLERVLGLLLMSVIFLGMGSAAAAPILTIRPITWNVIGLDSNDVTKGPDTYPVGARICNTGDAAASNVMAQFFFDSSNPTNYINLLGLQQLNLGNLPFGPTPPGPNTSLTIPSNCIDAYFNVIVTRTSSAYSIRGADNATPAQRKTRLYHIEASATGLSTISTPTPRELYVEKLLSQARNDVQSFTGPATVSVGQTAQYTLIASTATQGYEQLINFPVLINSVFQVLNVSTTYTAPSGGVNNIMYADACGWENNITSPNYHNNGTCIGPTLYGGKAGGSMTSVYTVKIISGGTSGVYNAINDFSGASYHYNSDYGETGTGFVVTSSNPDLTLTKTHTGNFTVGQSASFTFTVQTTGAAAYGTTTVSDALPTGLSLPDGPVTLSGPNALSWSCTSASNVITCNSTNSSAVPLITAGNTSSFTVMGIVVGSNAPDSVVNTATVSNPNEVVTNNNTATDTVTIVRSRIGLAKTRSAVTANGDGTYNVTYTLLVRNYSNPTAALSSVQITDSLSNFGTYTAINPPAAAGQYTISSAPVVSSATIGVNLTANTAFNGSSNTNLLTTAATNTLPNGGAANTNRSSALIAFTVKFRPITTSSLIVNNTATATAAGTGVSDVSDTQITNTSPATAGVVASLEPDPSGDGNPSGTNENDPTPFVLSFASELAVSKLAQAATSPFGTITVRNDGQSFRYLLTVENQGLVAETNVQVSDVLPNGVVLDTAVTPNPKFTGGTSPSYNSVSGLWTVGNLTSGGTATLELYVKLSSGGSQTSIVNTATLLNPPTGDNPGNNISSASILPNPVKLKKYVRNVTAGEVVDTTRVSSTATPGNTLEYCIEASSTLITAVNVNVSDTLMTNQTFDSSFPITGASPSNFTSPTVTGTLAGVVSGTPKTMCFRTTVN